LADEVRLTVVAAGPVWTVSTVSGDTEAAKFESPEYAATRW
jgi:hypothetical protein